MSKRRSFLGMLASTLLVGPLKTFAENTTPMQSNTDFESFDIDVLEASLKQGPNAYLPFLNVPKLRTGLYILPIGATDGQQPHVHDEVYYILEGKADFHVGKKTQEVSSGVVLYVKANVEHRFTNIREELKILVFFSNMT